MAYENNLEPELFTIQYSIKRNHFDTYTDIPPLTNTHESNEKFNKKQTISITLISIFGFVVFLILAFFIFVMLNRMKKTYASEETSTSQINISLI